MEQITADLQFLLKLRICYLCNIRVAVILLVTNGIIVHSLLQCTCDTDIINDQTALFITEHSVDTGDSLHQIIAHHRLIDIHRCKGRHIKACQPHIDHDSNFQRTVIVLEFCCKLLLVALVADDTVPFFGIFVRSRHDHSDLFLPARTNFKDTLVNLHSDSTGVCNDHCFTCQQVLTIVLIVIENIVNKGFYSIIVTEDSFHLPKLTLAFLYYISIGILCHDLIFGVYQFQGVFIEFQLHDTALIVNGTSRTVLNSLRHIVNVDIVTEHLTGVPILSGYRSTRKADICSIRERITDNSSRADDLTGNKLAVLILGHLDFFCQTILPSMGFISHNDDISSFRQRFARFLKLLHRGEDNAVSLATVKERFQVFTAFSVDRFLTEKSLAFRKLRIELIVKIVSVRDNNNSWAFKGGLEQMGIEHH